MHSLAGFVAAHASPPSVLASVSFLAESCVLFLQDCNGQGYRQQAPPGAGTHTAQICTQVGQGEGAGPEAAQACVGEGRRPFCVFVRHCGSSVPMRAVWSARAVAATPCALALLLSGRASAAHLRCMPIGSRQLFCLLVGVVLVSSWGRGIATAHTCAAVQGFMAGPHPHPCVFCCCSQSQIATTSLRACEREGYRSACVRCSMRAGQKGFELHICASHLSPALAVCDAALGCWFAIQSACMHAHTLPSRHASVRVATTQ